MKSKTTIAIVLILHGLVSFSQGEGNNWYFGENAGISFNGGVAQPLIDGNLWTHEGCAAISDDQGSLLFYSDGRQIWNRNHMVMPNGFGLLGDSSSAQSATIVKLPDSDSLYYVFTTPALGQSTGLRYSVVDMSLDGGLGDVAMLKNIAVVARTTERITAVKHENCRDYWIIVDMYDEPGYYSFLLSNNGLNTTPVISDSIPFSTLDSWTCMGIMQASHDGRKIAASTFAALSYGIMKVELFDFDRNTGELSNKITLSMPPATRPYGIEFSPSNRFLYVALNTVSGNNSFLYQYDLENGFSSTQIGSHTGVAGALQAAPDGRIYEAILDRDTIGVITNPNGVGTACSFIENGFSLNGRNSRGGLPDYRSKLLCATVAVFTDNVCFTDTTEFSFVSEFNPDSLQWDFGDTSSGITNYSQYYEPQHLFSAPGTYNVELTLFYNSYSHVVSETVVIYPIPLVKMDSLLTLCEDESFVLQPAVILPATGNFDWSDGSSNSFLSISDTGAYTLVYSNMCGSDTATVVVSDQDCHCDVYLPNTITANNDNLNEQFKAVFDCPVYDFDLSIYDRWGERIFFTSDPTISWDIKSSRKDLIGTYSYILRYANYSGVVKTVYGHVNVVQ